MTFFEKVHKHLTDPAWRFMSRASHGFYNNMPDEEFLRRKFKLELGQTLDLENPKTFNEKLQWLKLHDRNPLYTTMADKHRVKAYVTEKIGGEYVIPELGVWDSFDEIDFDKLPDWFVLKCNHDCGSTFICTDKAKIDRAALKKRFDFCISRNYYWLSREWPYKDIKSVIFAEEYMEDAEDGELRDYKFYCFNGKPHCLLLATGRQRAGDGLRFDYFDMDFKHLDLRNHWHPQADVPPHKPKNYEKMKKLAAMMSDGIPQVRVDFYEVNGRIYFGEFTFFDMGGFLILHPDDWNMEWGKLIQLPDKE